MRLLPAIAILAAALSVSGQTWTADHWAGYPVPTTREFGDQATLPIPTPAANIGLVSTLTTTDTPDLLGDLTGATIATVVYIAGSNNPAFWFFNDCGNHGPVANVRLFFSTDSRPYTASHANANEGGYWWAYCDTGWALLAEGQIILQASVSPENWSDALGHKATDAPVYMAMFYDAAAHVAESGYSFGGHCYYDNGVGVSTRTASATFHVMSYDVIHRLPTPPPSAPRFRSLTVDARVKAMKNSTLQ